MNNTYQCYIYSFSQIKFLLESHNNNCHHPEADTTKPDEDKISF